MRPPIPLQPAALYSACDPASLAFVTTADLPDLNAALIQSRAVAALHLGLDIQHPGYNLFVLGDTGSSRHAIIAQLLEARRKSGTPPADWCYVNNFAADARPRLMCLPCGRGARLRDDLQRFVGELGPAIAATFESDEYQRRIESIVHMGTLVSNFTLIKAGALHRANGGFLVLDALKVLAQPFAWEGLKRALKAGEIRIESLAELIGLTSTMQLEPAPVPLDLKVVLVGERRIYYLLAELDADFPALFKINADLDSELERNPENIGHYAQLIATLARRDKLPPLAAAGVARLIEHAARLANDAQRLTTQTRPLGDLMREAGHLAVQAKLPLIDCAQIEAALAAQRRRHERLRLRYQEEILRGQWLVDSAGLHVGQINGLAVVPLGDGSFAHPVRITATVRMGEGEVVDIEREVELGGPLHSKGVLILSSFLAARFGWAMPLSLKASLVFEQSYGDVEGDSASLAELAALLSALSGIPIRQALAVTGSVNQFGVVQPVGGINEKIEGFFDICAARGLSGEQGVLIPAANVCHLMLRRTVVEAVQQERFHVWAVEDIDAAMALLTGMPAGEPDAKGEVPAGSVNYQIALALAELAQMRQNLSQPKPSARRKKKVARRTPPP